MKVLSGLQPPFLKFNAEWSVASWKILDSHGVKRRNKLRLCCDNLHSSMENVLFFFFLVLTSTSTCKIICCTMGWNWNRISLLFFPKHVIEEVREIIYDTKEVVTLLFLHLCGEGVGLGPIRSAIIINKNVCIKQRRKVKGCSRRFTSDWEEREHDREVLHSFENSSNI